MTIGTVFALSLEGAVPFTVTLTEVGMSVKQVHEVISAMQGIHRALQFKLDTCTSLVKDENVLEAIKYLRQKEEKTVYILERFKQQTHDNVLNTFVRYYPDKEEGDVVELLNKSNLEFCKHFIGYIVSIKKKIISMCDACENALVIPGITELLGTIKRYEQSQLQYVGRRYNELLQIY